VWSDVTPRKRRAFPRRQLENNYSYVVALHVSRLARTHLSRAHFNTLQVFALCGGFALYGGANEQNPTRVHYKIMFYALMCYTYMSPSVCVCVRVFACLCVIRSLVYARPPLRVRRATGVFSPTPPPSAA